MTIMYFGALIAGVRVVWMDADKAQCVCRCGALFYQYRSCLRRAHRRGKRTMCQACFGPIQLELCSRAGRANAAKVKAERRAA